MNTCFIGRQARIEGQQEGGRRGRHHPRDPSHGHLGNRRIHRYPQWTPPLQDRIR